MRTEITCIPPHVHNFWQFYYVFKGDVEMTVSEQKIPMVNGDGVLVPPGVARSPKCNGKPPQYMFVFFENVALDLEGMSQHVLHTNAEQQNQFQKIMNEIELPKDRNSNHLMASIMVTMLIELRRSLQHAQSTSREYYQDIVARVDTYMQSNFHLPLKRSDLARIAHVSPPHLARIFHAILQMTPLERLTQLRMQHAEFMLTQSNQADYDDKRRCRL